MQSTNRTPYSTFMCFRRERDYMILLQTYNYTTIESIGTCILTSKVFEHYTSICAAREVTGWLSLCFVWSYNCMYMVLSSVCLCLSVCFYILSVFYCLMANKRVHNQILVELGAFQWGWVILSANFRWKETSLHTIFGIKKTRVFLSPDMTA